MYVYVYILYIITQYLRMDFFLNFPRLGPNSRSNCGNSSSSTSWSSRLHLQFLQIFRQKWRSRPGHAELQFVHGAPAPASCAKRGWASVKHVIINWLSILILYTLRLFSIFRLLTKVFTSINWNVPSAYDFPVPTTTLGDLSYPLPFFSMKKRL